ncbi:ribosome hibernation-promoting factor, HPF/YfiA family [Chlamydiota bacterium]
MSEKTKAEIKEKFAEFEYPVHVIGRHVSVTEPMQAYAIDKLSKVIDRFGLRVLEVTVKMDVQKLLHLVDFMILVNNTKIKVSGRSETMYASIDQAIGRLEAKVSRYKRRLSEHHAKKVSEVDMNVNIIKLTPTDDINDQIEEESLKKIEQQLKPHPVVSREKRVMKILNQEEAIMKMELSEDQFMIFRGEEDRKLKVIYRRNDGNYGIIEAEK